MSFDWTEKSKERYFRRVEKEIKKQGFDDFLHVDRTAFGIVAGNKVKVYVEKIHRKGNVKRWREAIKTFSELKECEPPKDEYGRKKKMIFLSGYFEIKMEG